MATIDNLIDEIERSYEELNAQLADPEVLGDRAGYAGIARKHAELQQVYELARRFREAERTVADAEGLLGDDSSDAEMRGFAQEELGEGRRRLEELSEEIRVSMRTRISSLSSSSRRRPSPSSSCANSRISASEESSPRRPSASATVRSASRKRRARSYTCCSSACLRAMPP